MNIKIILTTSVLAIAAILGFRTAQVPTLPSGYGIVEPMVGAQVYLPYQGGTGTGTTPNTGGKVLISTSGGVYTPAYLTAGSNIAIASSSGGITISAIGGSTFSGLDFGVIGGSQVKISSLSFDAGMFNLSNTASEGYVRLDWTNGPASRSTNNTWTATGSTSFAGSISISKGVNANSYQGAGLTPCTGSTFLQYTSGQFSCATPAGGGGSGAVGLRAGFTGAFTTKPSLSFDAGGFNVDTSNVDGRVFLDYTNGPASRAMANTWTEQQTFSNAVLSTTAVNASVSGRFEVGTSGLWTNGTNVGIGTNTPKGKLTVAGSEAQIIASGSGTIGLRLNATNATNGTEGMFQLNSVSTFELLRLTNGAGTVLSDISSRGFTTLTGTAVGTNTGTVLTVQTAQTNVKGLILNNSSGGPAVNYLELQLNGTQRGAITAGNALILGSTITAPDTDAIFEGAGNLIASRSVNSFVGLFVNDTNAESTQPKQRRFSLGTNGSTETFVIRDGNDTARFTMASAGWTGVNSAAVTGTYLNIGTTTVGTKLLILNNATGDPSGVTTVEYQLNGSRTGFVGAAGAQLGVGSSVRNMDAGSSIEANGNIIASASINGFTGFIANERFGTDGKEGIMKIGSFAGERFVVLNSVDGVIMNFASSSANTAGSYLNGGNLGIGDTTPTTTLDINGSASVSSRFEIGTYPAIGSTADALCKGTSGVISTNTGSPTCTVSSEKYKRSITQLTSSLDIIRELQPVTFINKGDPYNREHFGLVAEQVAQVEPRLVFYEVQRTLKDKALEHMVENPKYEPKDEDYEVTMTNDPRGVKYEEVVGVLVGAMKEQQAQLDALDARLTALEGGKSLGFAQPTQSLWDRISTWTMRLLRLII